MKVNKRRALIHLQNNPLLLLRWDVLFRWPFLLDYKTFGVTTSGLVGGIANLFNCPNFGNFYPSLSQLLAQRTLRMGANVLCACTFLHHSGY
jgi:hypothetical protein